MLFQKVYINLECHFIEVFPHYVHNGEMVVLQHVRIAVNYLLQENPAAFNDEPIFSLIQLYERLVESENDDVMTTGLDIPAVAEISDNEPENEEEEEDNGTNGYKNEKENDDDDSEDDEDDDEFEDLPLFDLDDDLQEMMSFEIEKERKLKQEKRAGNKGGKHKDSKRTTPSKQPSDDFNADSAKEPENSTLDVPDESNDNAESQNTRLEMAEIDKMFPPQKVVYVESLPFEKNKASKENNKSKSQSSKENGKAKNPLSKVSANVFKNGEYQQQQAGICG
ncbi:unnamed protein product [Ambrosiozyma monospora]|uniref:Unnamed protein product n=1 Tax=Ambrosiozyma monospora TaxID=43982 RepID=A0ACB5TZ12_AMBMO|nr:unnamed protein product [Ambrosiozyma monospora]